MQRKIILSADSTCDLGEELKNRYHVHYFPFHIILGDQQFSDGVDITPDDLYHVYRQRKLLPKTAAIGVGEYVEYFSRWVRQGYDVIHLNLGAALSAAYQNCCLAAEELGHVYPINSCNLSTGIGLLVLEAADRITRGMCAQEVQQEIIELTGKVNASFVLDTLEFMHAGGRCNAVTALGANLLRLKPCIEVDNTSGAMKVGKKYRGTLDKVLLQYVGDRLKNRDEIHRNRVFITHSGISRERVSLVCHALKELVDFREIYVTRAGCTISSHCGPNTLGVLFMTR
jgi:DegV family protein with EDD domain